jgi:hypothetical protein
MSLEVRPTVKKESQRLRESGLIFTANVRIGDKNKSSASLLENEIRLTVGSHMNIIPRYQRVWLNIVQTPCYSTAHQVRHKGIKHMLSRTNIFTLHAETPPRARCYNPALGVTQAMSYPKGGCYQVPARATVGVFPYPSNTYCLEFPPSNGVSSYPKSA